MTIGNLSSSKQGGLAPKAGNNPLQTPGPTATIQDGMEVSMAISWELRGNLRVQTQSWKFLLSKLVQEGGDSLSKEERFVLPLLYDRLSNCKDRGWVEKYSNWFETTKRLFNYFTLCNYGEKKAVWSNEVVSNSFFSGGLLSACAFFGRRTFFNVRNVLRKINRNLRKKPRPPNRIGVGYRDHGAARDVAYDGSPAWQEVAAAHLKSESTNPTEIEAYKTYLWKISGRRTPYHFFSIDSL